MKLLKRSFYELMRIIAAIPFAIAGALPFIAAAVAVFAVTHYLTIKGYAEMQAFYNVAFTIDRADEDRFNEKIEVYVEKNGEYYGDYDLNQVNGYTYKTVFETGTYTAYARVRYDNTGTYTVSPEQVEVKVSPADYEDMHTATFEIAGGISTDDENGHTVTGEEESGVPGGKVYTIDDIEELRKMQESDAEAVSKAFSENEKWEQENNFLAQHGVENPAVPYEDRDSPLPLHSYPETSAERTETQPQTETETETQPESETSNVEVLPDETNHGTGKDGMPAVKAVAAASIIIIALAAITVSRKRKRRG